MMKTITKTNLYIESYKMIYNLENAQIYNELSYYLYTHWEEIKSHYRIHQIIIPKINLKRPLSQIMSILYNINNQHSKIYNITIKLPDRICKKYKTIVEWNRYIKFLCRYAGIDYHDLSLVRMRIEEKISLYEYVEICKLFLRK